MSHPGMWLTSSENPIPSKSQIQQNEKEQVFPTTSVTVTCSHTMDQDYPLTVPSPGGDPSIHPSFLELDMDFFSFQRIDLEFRTSNCWLWFQQTSLWETWDLRLGRSTSVSNPHRNFKYPPKKWQCVQPSRMCVRIPSKVHYWYREYCHHPQSRFVRCLLYIYWIGSDRNKG